MVGVGIECSSVADETPSPLLSGEVLLAADFSGAQHFDAFAGWRYTTFGAAAQLHGTSHTARFFSYLHILCGTAFCNPSRN